MFNVVFIGKFGVRVFKVYNCGFLSRILKKYLPESYLMISVVSCKNSTGCAVFYIFPSENSIKILNPLIYNSSRALIRVLEMMLNALKQTGIRIEIIDVDEDEVSEGYL